MEKKGYLFCQAPLVILALVLGLVAENTPWYAATATDSKGNLVTSIILYDGIIISTSCLSTPCITLPESYPNAHLATAGGVISSSDSCNKVACALAGFSLVVIGFLVFAFWTEHKFKEEWTKWAKLILMPALGLAMFLYFLAWVLLLRLPSAFANDEGSTCTASAAPNNPCKTFSGSITVSGATESWGPGASFGLDVVASLLSIVAFIGSIILWRKGGSSPTPKPVENGQPPQ